MKIFLLCLAVVFVLSACGLAAAEDTLPISFPETETASPILSAETEDVPRMLLVDGVLYEHWITGETFAPDGIPRTFFLLTSVHIGEVQSQVAETGIPAENFQANHDIVGAEVRRSQFGGLSVIFDESRESVYLIPRDPSDSNGCPGSLLRANNANAFYIPFGGIWEFSDDTLDNTYVFIGEVQSLTETSSLPYKNFQANHEILGARLYRSGKSLVAVLNTDCGVFYIRYV